MSNRFEIRIANDEMEAHICVAAGDPCNRDDIRSALASAGVREGILEEALEKLGGKVAQGSFASKDQLIAKGKPAREGKAGVLHIRNSKDIPASHLVEGSGAKKGKGGKGDPVSFLTSVIPDQEVGQLNPSDPGEPGFTVKAKVLACSKVEDPRSRLGAGLTSTSDNRVTATSTGVLCDREGEGYEVVPLPSNKRVLLEISNDKMRATARVFPGEPGDAQAVTEALACAEVTHGIVDALCEELGEKLSNPLIRIDEMALAIGTPALPGKDGHFDPAFTAQTLAGKIRSDGSIDFRDRSTLVVVTAGEVLGVYHAPIHGTEGHDVQGGELPFTPGKDNPPKLGDGAELREGGNVVATVDGIINCQSGGTLEVNDAYEHRGDVDLKSGDLKMNGAIIVTGDITRGAKVQAVGGVVIKGMIDAGGVESDGPVTVLGGVMVEEKAWIRARGDVICRHTQGARIECKETITVQQNAVNSLLKAKAIVGESKSMRILGGIARAEEQIVVGKAGSDLGARTVLSVAVPLNWDYDTVASQLGEAAPAKKTTRGKKGRRSKPDRKSGKAEKAESSTAVAKRLLEIARIEVTGTLHSGVVIEIGKLSMTIEREMHGVCLRYSTAGDEPEISITSVQPAQTNG